CSKQQEQAQAAGAPGAPASATSAGAAAQPGMPEIKPIKIIRQTLSKTDGRALVTPRERTVIRLAAYEQVKSDPVLYAHATRVLHLETNPGNARALVQRHSSGGVDRDVWFNPPPIPLTTVEMDHVFDLPYARSPHPR